MIVHNDDGDNHASTVVTQIYMRYLTEFKLRCCLKNTSIVKINCLCLTFPEAIFLAVTSYPTLCDNGDERNTL